MSLKVIGISGSPRDGGNTDVLLECFSEGIASTGVQTETVFLRDYFIQPCVACEKCRKDETCTGLKDGMHLLYPKILESRGLVLGSPTHNYNVTAIVKAFIDRLYPFFEFSDDRPRKYSSRMAEQGRKAIVFSVSEQDEMGEIGFTLEAMGYPLTALGYEVVGDFNVTGFFDRGAVRADQKLLELAAEKGQQLAQILLNS